MRGIIFILGCMVAFCLLTWTLHELVPERSSFGNCPASAQASRYWLVMTGANRDLPDACVLDDGSIKIRPTLAGLLAARYAVSDPYNARGKGRKNGERGAGRPGTDRHAYSLSDNCREIPEAAHVF